MQLEITTEVSQSGWMNVSPISQTVTITDMDVTKKNFTNLLIPVHDANVVKDFRLTNVNFRTVPAQLGTLLLQKGSEYNVSYIINRKGLVSDTSPKEVYGVITVNGTGVADVTFNDTFSVASGNIQFIVYPAKLLGGAEIIRYNTTTGIATVLTRTTQITSAFVNNAAQTVNLTIRLNIPLARDENLMVYIKYATALKGKLPNYADFVNEAVVATNLGTPELRQQPSISYKLERV